MVSVAAIRMSGRFHERDLDADLALHAMAAYGLAWLDEDGLFHDEFLRREPLLQGSPSDLWIVEPADPVKIHFRPENPAFRLPGLAALARRTVRRATSSTADGRDEAGRAYRIHAIPSFDDNDVARMAVVVVGDPAPGRTTQMRFVRGLAASATAIGLLGIAVGALLAGRSLRPVAETYEQRERFLGGAAHELRNPVAAMQAICESAEAGDEPAERALARLIPVVRRTGRTVNELLLFARLDARRLALETTRVRLDLLVESILPEDERVTFGGEASEVLADPGLVEVAVGNIVENALKHGCTDGSPPRVTVSVGAGRVVVEDEGPGFDRELLASVKEAFVASRQSAGVGLGMALATMIAELHGGRLDVENRKGGGSRVVFDLSSADVRKISGKPL